VTREAFIEIGGSGEKLPSACRAHAPRCIYGTCTVALVNVRQATCPAAFRRSIESASCADGTDETNTGDLMILVTGATGHVGSHLVRLLAAQGHAVRALVRDPVAARFPEGVDIAVGNLDDAPSVERAVDGMEVIFHMQANHGLEHTRTMISAARAAGVERIVAMSSIAAVIEPLAVMGTSFRAQENLWRDSDLKVTFLRPNTFMSNALWWRNSIRASGVVSDPCGDGRMSFVDTNDIAAVAAITLTQPGHVGHGYILTGREALTTREQISVLGDVLGRPLSVVDVTPHEFAAASVARGEPSAMVPVLENLYGLLREGRFGIIAEDIRHITGRPAGTFRAWCERNVGAFR
jgi:uncharacterized protein YbjT (DUF2867 family)